MALASHLLFGLGIAAWTRTARATKADEPKWYTAQRQAEASHAAHGYPLGPPRPPRALRIKVTNRSPTGRDLFLFTYLTVEAQTNLSQ